MTARPLATVQVIGHLREPADLHEIMRARADELQLTREGIDAMSGLQNGYASKVLAPDPSKGVGPIVWRLMLPVLGMKIVAVVDEEALERITKKGPKRRIPAVSQARAWHFQLSTKELKRRARKGGSVKSSAKTAAARRNARKRWEKPKLTEITKKVKS